MSEVSDSVIAMVEKAAYEIQANFDSIYIQPNLLLRDYLIEKGSARIPIDASDIYEVMRCKLIIKRNLGEFAPMFAQYVSMAVLNLANGFDINGKGKVQ